MYDSRKYVLLIMSEKVSSTYTTSSDPKHAKIDVLFFKNVFYLSKTYFSQCVWQPLGLDTKNEPSVYMYILVCLVLDTRH